MSELPDRLAAHLVQPHGVGRPTTFDAEGRGTNPACGDDLRIYATLAGDALALRFEASACAAVLAVASFTVAALAGGDRRAAGAFDVAAAVEAAGGLPRHRAHAPRVVQRALDQALAAL